MSEQQTSHSFRTLPFAQPTHCRRYEGRIAIVTGAAPGLGRVIAKRLAEEGAKLVVCDIQEDRLAVAARELREETGMPFLAVAGDLSEPGVAATFDGPARAVRCAASICQLVPPLGIAVRSGLHNGEVELKHDDVTGIAVHIAARVAAEAEAGETVVSSTVRDLVAGSGLRFQDRGIRAPKELPEEMHPYGVLDAR
jgi:NAD(P)-dependent dehydrogenase (short-subunit alcohol dehydrogenase family)